MVFIWGLNGHKKAQELFEFHLKYDSTFVYLSEGILWLLSNSGVKIKTNPEVVNN